MGQVSSVDPLPANPQLYDLNKTGASQGVDISAPSGISTIGELQKMYPELIRAMQESLFMEFRGRQDRSNARIKEILREQGQSNKR
jgi:hypothetical protein